MRRKRVHQVRIGTSGWSYGHWRGIFYPEDLPSRDWLGFYQKHFDTVEINSTFYHMPRQSTCEAWRERAPEGFVYALKASRLITHEKRLVGAEEPLEEFLGRARILGDRLGPVLYQLPPSFRRDLGLLESFLKLLPSDMRNVFEFRNDTWFCDETYELLSAHGACFCTHDMPGRPSPRVATGPAAYVRFHGPERRFTGAYPDELLSDWAAWLKAQLHAGRDVYAYFNNDIGGHAVRDAQKLRAALAS